MNFWSLNVFRWIFIVFTLYVFSVADKNLKQSGSFQALFVDCLSYPLRSCNFNYFSYFCFYFQMQWKLNNVRTMIKQTAN